MATEEAYTDEENPIPPSSESLTVPDYLVTCLMAFEAGVRAVHKIAKAKLATESLGWFFDFAFDALSQSVIEEVKRRQELGEPLPKLTEDEYRCAEAIANIGKAMEGEKTFDKAIPILVRLHASLSKETPANVA